MFARSKYASIDIPRGGGGQWASSFSIDDALVACDNGSKCSRHITASAQYVAFPVSSGGGTSATGDIGVFDHRADRHDHGSGRRNKRPSRLLHGHTGGILDLAFSRLSRDNEALLASTARDGTVRVWDCPPLFDAAVATSAAAGEGGKEKVINLAGGADGVAVKWHPLVDGVLGVATSKADLQLHDARHGAAAAQCAMPSAVHTFDFDADGHLCAVFSADGACRGVDARSGSIVWTQPQCHSQGRLGGGVACGVGGGGGGGGSPRFPWYCFVTTGFGAARKRELKLWDVRKMGSSLKTVRFDSSTGVLLPIVDSQSGLLTLVGRGDTFVRTFDLGCQGLVGGALASSASSLPKSVTSSMLRPVGGQGGRGIHTEGNRGKTATAIGGCTLPRTELDVMGCECLRVFKLTRNGVSVMPMVATRRDKSSFDAISSLFPPGPSAKAEDCITSAGDYIKDTETGTKLTLGTRGGDAEAEVELSGEADQRKGEVTLSRGKDLTPKFVSMDPSVRIKKKREKEKNGKKGSGVPTRDKALEKKESKGNDFQNDANPKDGTAAVPPSRPSSRRVSAFLGTKSKFRYIRGHAGFPPPGEEALTGLKIDFTATAGDSEGITASADGALFAVPWKQMGGGALYVGRTEARGKLTTLLMKNKEERNRCSSFVSNAAADASFSSVPLLQGHRSAITDLRFAPFTNPRQGNKHTLASSAEDGEIIVWTCGHDGSSGSSASLEGHVYPVRIVRWHPSARQTLLSGARDGLRLWDVDNQSSVATFPLSSTSLPTSLSFDATGNHCAVTQQDGSLRIIDIRARTKKGSAFDTGGAGGPGTSGKGMRVAWAKGTPYLCVTAFGDGKRSGNSSMRHLRIIDARQMKSWDESEAVASHLLGSGSAILRPYYDEDTGLVTLAGRGENVVRVFEVTKAGGGAASDGEMEILSCDAFRGEASGNLAGITLLPKSTYDVGKVEVLRFLRLGMRSDSRVGGAAFATGSVEPLSFTVPRAARLAGLFDDTVFPPTRDLSKPVFDSIGTFCAVSPSAAAAAVEAVPRRSLQPKGSTLLSTHLKDEARRKAHRTVPTVSEAFAARRAKEEQDAEAEAKHLKKMTMRACQFAKYNSNWSGSSNAAASTGQDEKAVGDGTAEKEESDGEVDEDEWSD